MPQPLDHDSQLDFAALATRLKLIDAGDESALRTACSATAVAPWQTAVSAGLLSLEAADILRAFLEPRDAIPGYEVLDLLGRGGMGVVYLARQLALDRVVAVKTILVGQMATAGIAERFKQEARTIAQLKHPNIVSAFDFGQHAGRLYLAMEYVDGGNAESLVQRRGPLAERTVWGIIRQAAAGLAHAWSRGIVHRDIKPANLLVVDQASDGFALPPGVPLVMIADFGVAQLTDMVDGNTRLTADNVTVGSPHYMAPEQLESSEVDFRADIYGLGATALYLLTAKTPLGELRLPQLIARKLGAEPLVDAPEFRGRLSPAMRATISGMTERAPERRPESYAALIAEIDRRLRGDETAAAAHTSAFDAARESERSRGGGSPANAIESGTMADTAVTAAAFTADAAAAGGEAGDALPRSMPEAESDGRADAPALGLGRRRLAVILLGAAALAGVATWAAGLWPAGRSAALLQAPPPRPAMKHTGFSQYVFNGSNLTNWKKYGGNWVVPPGVSVIAGTDGSIGVYLVKRGPNDQQQPLEHYRLEGLVELRAAEAARMEFAIVAAEGAAPDDSRESWGIQITDRQAAFVHRAEFSSDWQIVGTPLAIDTSKPQYVMVERTPVGWYATVGQTPLGFTRLSGATEIAEFRWGATGGPAWFSDAVVTELTAGEVGG